MRDALHDVAQHLGEYVQGEVPRHDLANQIDAVAHEILVDDAVVLELQIKLARQRDRAVDAHRHADI
ncbi:hypothetical protein D3C72_2000900 [compost metagenome]